MKTNTNMSKPAFWITNMSPMNVTLADLALTVRAYSTVNLLDSKHYNYTLSQLNASAAAGSIFKKRDKIAVRKVAPETKKSSIPIRKESVMSSRERSVFVIKEIEYEELDVSDQKKQDEIYANDNAELADVNVDIKNQIKKGI